MKISTAKGRKALADLIENLNAPSGALPVDQGLPGNPLAGGSLADPVTWGGDSEGFGVG